MHATWFILSDEFLTSHDVACVAVWLFDSWQGHWLTSLLHCRAISLCLSLWKRTDCRVQGIYRDAIGQNPIDNVTMMLLLGGVQSPYFWSTNFVESWNGAPSAENFIPTGITFGLATSWWILLQIVFLDVTGPDANGTILYALDSETGIRSMVGNWCGHLCLVPWGPYNVKKCKDMINEVQMEMEPLIRGLTSAMASSVLPSYATSWSILVKLNCTLRDFSVEIREVLRFFLALAYEIQLDVVSSLHVKAVHDSKEK